MLLLSLGVFGLPWFFSSFNFFVYCTKKSIKYLESLFGEISLLFVGLSYVQHVEKNCLGCSILEGVEKENVLSFNYM